MESIVYLNGDFVPVHEAKISVFDRGFLFADSVYEVIPVYQGQIHFFDLHLQRLEQSLQAVKINYPEEDWSSILNTLIHKNGGGNLQIYLQITRGDQGVRKHDIPHDLKPTIVAFTIHNPYPTFTEKQKGLTAALVNDIRWLRCNIKSTALLANILLNDEATSHGAQTAILVRDNRVTEGSASNIFIVDAEGVICTPLKNTFCLPGITRHITLQLISKLNLDYKECDITREQLVKAQEVWITSTTKEIYPVTKIDEKIIGSGIGGKVWQRLEEAYQQLIK